MIVVINCLDDNREPDGNWTLTVNVRVREPPSIVPKETTSNVEPDSILKLEA